MENWHLDIWDINERALDPHAALAFATDAPNGAETLFVGTIRNRNHGRDVTGITYDVFKPLALTGFATICEEACTQWGNDLRIYLVHAQGRLDVGGVGVVIAVGAPHRDEAFRACRYIIEQVKHRSPIWKLEHYTDGDSEWTQGCQLCTSAVHSD